MAPNSPQESSILIDAIKKVVSIKSVKDDGMLKEQLELSRDQMTTLLKELGVGDLSDQTAVPVNWSASLIVDGLVQVRKIITEAAATEARSKTPEKAIEKPESKKPLPSNLEQKEPLTEDQIFYGVQEVLVDALGVDHDEVRMEAKLVEDLGAQSIDFLDIAFRLEKEFGIKVNRSALFEEIRAEGPFGFTDQQLDYLKKQVPDGDFSFLESNRDSNAVLTIYTVKAVVRYTTTLLRAMGR